MDRYLLLDHDEFFYCGDDLVDSSEDKESEATAVITNKFTRVMRRATLVNNQLQKFKKRSGATL